MPSDPFDDLIRDMDDIVLDTFGVPAVVTDPVEQQVHPVMVVIDRDIQVVSDDGYTTITQTHASFNPPKQWQVERGHEVVTTSERYRLVTPISDDGSMGNWVVQKIGTVDLQDITDAGELLNAIVNEW